MSWVWLSASELDFGGSAPAATGDHRTVWLHADPYAALGLDRSADADAVKHAYRRLARQHHPDVAEPELALGDRFHEVQSAARAITGVTDVSVEPTAGAWWKFAGFSQADPGMRTAFGLTGIRFEITDVRRVPTSRPAEDPVRISCAGQEIPLVVRYTGSRFALPVWLARATAALESGFLVALCLTIIPIVAVLLGLDMFLLTDQNPVVTWAVALLILGGGYGALIAILTAAGRRAPSPRRAVLRTRTVVADLRQLARGRT